MFLRDPVHHTLRDEGLTNGMLHLIGYIFSGRCSVPSTVLFAKVASRRIPETCTVVYRVAQVLFYLTPHRARVDVYSPGAVQVRTYVGQYVHIQ